MRTTSRNRTGRIVALALAGLWCLRVPAVSAEPAPADPLEARIVVQVKNAPLATFLDTVSAQAKVNFIIAEGLEQMRMTAFLKNVTVREALRILLEIKGLTYRRIGRSNIYAVSKRAKGIPNLITRAYAVKHISLDPIGKKGRRDSIAIVDVLRTVLTAKYGKIAVYPPTKSIVVTDVPEVFPLVEEVLAELDRKSPRVVPGCPSEAGPPPADPLDACIVLRMKNAPLTTFLDTISAQAKVNFLITEGLEQKRMTAFLKNVTVRDALQVLIENRDLTYWRIGHSNTYMVSKRAKGIADRIVHIHNVKHISLKAIRKRGRRDSIAIVDVLRTVLTKKYGRIAVYPPTKSIVITDVPEVFPQVEEILADLDRKPVEARGSSTRKGKD